MRGACRFVAVAVVEDVEVVVEVEEEVVVVVLVAVVVGGRHRLFDAIVFACSFQTCA